jgi:hypothetical protein
METNKPKKNKLESKKKTPANLFPACGIDNDKFLMKSKPKKKLF